MNYEYITYVSEKVESIWKYFSEKNFFFQYQPAPLLNFSFKIDEGFQLGTDTQVIMEGIFKRINNFKQVYFELKYLSDCEKTVLVKITLLPLGEMSAIHLIVENNNEESLELSKNQWPGMMSQLKTLIETGHGLPWPRS